MSSDIQKLQRAGRRWWVRQERARWLYATLGRTNSDGTVTVAAPRQNYVWITMDTGTLTQAYNKGNGAVPLRAGLPVKVRDDAGRLIIDGENTSGLLEGDDNAPGSVYSVNDIGPDSHGNVILAIPVKATGAEVDTGTDDAKFVTPKAMEDSSYIKAAYADAKVADVITDGVTTIAPSENAVFDALATKQALDATLTSIAGLGTAADKMLYTTGVDTWAELATLAYGRSLLGATNIAAAQTTLALVPGTNVQAYDATLLSIAALGTAADRMLYTTGVDTWAELTTTSYGRAFLALANAAALAPVMATSAHGATLDTAPLDADEVVGMDSSASFGLIRTTWTSIKAFLKTYFDTLYGQLAAANTWVANNAFNSTATSGSALSVTRNLTATSTDASVVSILQDHASDDQDALKVTQDGSGDIISGYSGAVRNFGITGGGIFVANATAKATPGLIAAGTFQMSDLTDPFQLLVYMNGSATPASRWMGLQVVEQNQAYRELLLNPFGSKVGIGLSAAPGASVLGIKAGTSTNDAAVGGVLYVDSGTHANGTTVETDLATYTVPADTLSANNMELCFEAWGTYANNANTKTLKVKFGSDSYTLQVDSGGNSTWRLRGRIVRTGAATQDVFYEYVNTAIAAPVLVFGTATRTLSGSNILKLTGQSSVAGNDVKQEYFKVEWCDSNT